MFNLDLKRFAIQRALYKVAPNIIPLSGADRLRQRDYYVVALGSSNEDSFIAQALNDEGVTGIDWADGSNDPQAASRSNSQIAATSVSVTHYFREAEVRYSPATFALGQVIPLSLLTLSLSRFKKWLFGLKRLVRNDRYVVLQWAVEQHLSNGERAFSAEYYLNSQHSQRWMGHPRAREQLRYYLLVFESLHSSGELQRDASGSYRVTGAALATLASLEAENRKHADSVGEQKRMSWLTTGLLVVGAPAAIDASIKLYRLVLGH